jgi:hypothetical protein
MAINDSPIVLMTPVAERNDPKAMAEQLYQIRGKVNEIITDLNDFAEIYLAAHPSQAIMTTAQIAANAPQEMIEELDLL